jgi:ribosomal protein L7Ae-like RNA K-turn-binding protein
MRNNKFYSNLGLAMRAGKVITGEDGIVSALKSGHAKLVIMAEDASANTSKKLVDKCSHYGVPVISFGTRSELGGSIGKAERVAVAITDAGFAANLKKALEQAEV